MDCAVGVGRIYTGSVEGATGSEPRGSGLRITF